MGVANTVERYLLGEAPDAILRAEALHHLEPGALDELEEPGRGALAGFGIGVEPALLGGGGDQKAEVDGGRGARLLQAPGYRGIDRSARGQRMGGNGHERGRVGPETGKPLVDLTGDWLRDGLRRSAPGSKRLVFHEDPPGQERRVEDREDDRDGPSPK